MDHHSQESSQDNTSDAESEADPNQPTVLDWVKVYVAGGFVFAAIMGFLYLTVTGVISIPGWVIPTVVAGLILLRVILA
ncbi:hypothetical protein [Micromonospora sp. NPDC048169]|uniref:hypothetical protein n=1 Tax=Micromonospora sp. NPDC048169 TaxID=3154711 RepID=UPI0033C5C71D